ncbi:protein of unknown function (DU1801) [Marivirga sericea]|uniref:YdhG-like domain-containing protein n=1 Tax=Marivirga sericea TaxID=1028 RepID=A0A1X7J2P6_9BACT|nr:DUF1801 domain-containing protein [Marivirga sericea]SMG21950.1 protein of unknown function (DU1801) [Marivirga sericea]
MGKLLLKRNPQVDQVFNNYPDAVRGKMQFLRKLVIETAEETEGVDQLEETLKWNEPSFVNKNGSTLRMDWKKKAPHQYAIYFQCSSRLVETFRIVFEDKFNFEGNRAVVFDMKQDIPVVELKECIKTALIYHKVKDLMTLGL